MEAAGQPPPTYQWCRNGQALHAPSPDNATIVIPSIDPTEHAGDYQVKVANYKGSRKSQKVAVVVNGPPTNVKLEQVIPPFGRPPVANEVVRFECKAASSSSSSPSSSSNGASASSSSSSMTCIWLRNGEIIDYNNSVPRGSSLSSGDSSNPIHEVVVTPDQEGGIQCIAINSMCEKHEARGVSRCPVSAVHPLSIVPCGAGQRRDNSTGACM